MKILHITTLLILLFSGYIKAQTPDFIYFNKTIEADTMNLLAQVVRPIEDGCLVLGGTSL